MEQKYAHALRKLAEGGIAPQDAVAAVARALEARGRGGLLSRVGKAFARLAVRAARRKRKTLIVARESDAAAARAASGFAEAETIIDDSLIGGWRLEEGDTLTDASYKKYLLDMYNRATRA